ncbi:MAG TPA: TOBE domain-containing protein [Thermoanaerobaculia bacterium]|nr:TOBE domain-containing protein [Thermoanaerobaculia bacterium]
MDGGAEGLGLEEGKEVYAVIKASDVMIGLGRLHWRLP